MNQMGSRLKEARKHVGLTKKFAAEKMHVPIETLVSWEAETEVPDLEKVPELAELYGVTTDWILAGKLPTEAILEVTSDLSDRLFDEKRMATYVGAYCNAKYLWQTRRALSYARIKHAGQFRKPGHGKERIPYIYHPLLLTCHALALGIEEDDLLSACLLHDVCEDCDVEIDELPVNENTKEAVRCLTKPKDFDRSEEAEQAYFEQISKNRIATMVKLLDRCNNISSMATSFSDEKMAGYIKETITYISPLLRKARHQYPEYSNALFLIRYHMNSVLEAMRHHMSTRI